MMKTLFLRFPLILLLIGSGETWALARPPAQTITVPLDRGITITEMNYHSAWFESDPNNPLPPPGYVDFTSRGNTARAALSATPGQAGVAQALVGVDFTWDLGSRTWDQVKDLPIQVTLDYQYSIAAYWDSNGSANAVAEIRPPAAFDGWRDALGLEVGEIGSRGGTETTTYTTTVEELGNFIHFFVYAQVHVASNRTGTNSSSATVTVNSITIKRADVPVLLVHGYCSTEAMWGPEHWPFGGAFDFKKSLEDQGFRVGTIRLSQPTNGSIWIYAKELAQKITEMKRDYNVDQVDIVAHSMGGLVARVYAWQQSSKHDVRTLIMMGTPNNGSRLLSSKLWRFLRKKFLMILPCFYPNSEAAWQMTPNGPFLNLLNRSGLQPSIGRYYTIAGDIPSILPGWASLSNSALQGSDDGIVQVASVQAISGTINSTAHVNHLEYDDDATVFNIVVNILRGTISNATLSVSAQQSTSDYQESTLIEDSVAFGDENDHAIPIDSTISEVSFVLMSNEENELNFTLTSPGDRLITPTVAASDPLITYTTDITTVTGYDITDPEQGNWTAHVAISGTASSEVGYVLLTFFDSELSLSILSNDHIYQINDSVPLVAQLMNNSSPVTGAALTAKIESPGGSAQVLPLYDDGSHGDTQAGDGTYSNLYTNTVVGGVYEITVTASGTMSDEQFVRETDVMIWVEGNEIYLPLILRN